jgi:hypothetical protein
MKSQEINVLLKDYTILEYVSSSLGYKEYIIRAKDKNLWFDFRLRSGIDYCDSNYKLNEYIEIYSYLDSLPDLSSNLYVCIYKDDKIIRYRCGRPVIYKTSGNKVYVFYSRDRSWNLDADFELSLTPNKNCYEKEWEAGQKTGGIVQPDQEELILKKISYSKSGQKIFSFVKCLPSSTYQISYEYIKDLGRVEIQDTDSGITWKLNKIDNEFVEIWDK